MSQSRSTVQTEQASRYLQQLCKHFGHKIDVDFSPEKGECTFPFAVVRMTAVDNALNVEVDAPDDEKRDQAQDVIERHLVRFAFREELPPMNWRGA